MVGRPNVGKSTLFNRLSKSRQALVSDFEGLTRDRQYVNIELDDDIHCTIVDTGEGFSGLFYNLTGDIYLDLSNKDEAKKYYGLAIENVTANSSLTQLIQIKLDDLN